MNTRTAHHRIIPELRQDWTQEEKFMKNFYLLINQKTTKK
jgi:hypothetical protein